jgi:hypothetical protein
MPPVAQLDERTDAALTRGRGRARRRARSTVVGALVWLALLNAALAAAAYLRPGLRDPLFDQPARDFQRRVEAANDRPITVAFLGSSRTGWGIRPVLAEEAVAATTGRPCIAHNLHVPGNGPVGQLVDWRRLVDRGLRPDVAVIELCPPWLAAPNGVPAEAGAFHGDRMTWPEVELARSYGFPASVETEWREATYNPWFGLRFQLVGLVRPKWLPPGAVRPERLAAEHRGWRVPFFIGPVPRDHYLAAVQQNRSLFEGPTRSVRADTSPARALRDLVRECREDGAKVAVWVTPEASDVRAWYSPESDRALRTLMAELQADGVVAVDGREWLPDEAFSDGHHAVRSWADAYTRHVVEQALLPALRR